MITVEPVVGLVVGSYSLRDALEAAFPAAWREILAHRLACRLTLHLPWQSYARLGYVVLRPEECWHRPHRNDLIVGITDGSKVTMSWPTLLGAMADDGDGDNVGYHEFAHVLDWDDGSSDGYVSGPHPRYYCDWIATIADARRAVADSLTEGCPLPAYAAKNDGELFAVATEWFFERPQELADRLPALYELLATCYRVDHVRPRRR